ncbi:two-component system sensor histidine kinase RppB [Leptolyngbya ohadii]|uniref:two-component system sensor histidine kinase RppB n=1 Tax=Leptolyngbya ohadii TaxID=1962290 RepID=UPI000B59F1D4|nr:two-component system sensor histidine kinase RppB [Leptolyngbya ohadii]
MHQNKVFSLTRWRLAAWYAGVMGIILSLSGLAIYFLMDWVHWQGLHQELQSVAGTLHDSLEPQLKQPGQVEPIVERLLPGLCGVGEPCAQSSKSTETPIDYSGDTASHRHILGAVHQEGYYVRMVNRSGQVVAALEYRPLDLPVDIRPLWQTLQDAQGNRYHQISLDLKTESGSFWGYIQVGRSLRDFDAHLASTRLVLLTGLPLILLLTTAVSWWQAGRAMQPVYRSYRQIQQFTADAAHELRTPLAASRATLEVALQTPHISEEESRSTLQTLERQNLRLSQLVQDLLLLSRMDIQEGGHKYKACLLNDIVSDVVDEYSDLAFSASILLSAELRVNHPVCVVGDEEQLFRLIANLVTNAIQYTPSGGKVIVGLSQDEHSAVVQVQDTGMGIAAADQTRIFDRFYRVNDDRSRHTGGAGLGLAIVQAIALAHHGTVQVQSEVGKGSLFTLRLPLRGNQAALHQ